MQTEKSTQTPYNVLIVDPDVEFAGLVAQAIDDADGTYSVTIGTETQEALNLLREAQPTQNPFHLLIVDVRTQGAGGIRLLEELVQSYPELKIVTMTGQHSPELAARVHQLQVHTYLVKPIAPSRFRRIVHDALAGKRPDTDFAAPLSPLTSTQQAAVERRLANLRRATGSTAALLVHASGLIRALDCMDPGLDAQDLCDTLVDAQRSIAQALAQTMQTANPIRQSYFGTDHYGICAHRLDDTHTVATIFGPEVREGQVWYVMREEIEALQKALEADTQEAPSPRFRPSNDGIEMVERYFAQQDTPGAHPRRSSRERVPPSPASAQRQARTPTRPPGTQSSPSEEPAEERAYEPPAPDVAPPELPAPLEMERLEIDQVDWEFAGSQDWDTLVADVDQAFLGMSFEEAKARGLLDNLDASK